MKKKIKIKHEVVDYKAIMVRGATHRKVAVGAKSQGMTLDKFVNSLLKK